MTKLLITGGAGFIGTYFVRLALDTGQQVWLLNNLSPPIHGGNSDLQRAKGADFCAAT